MYNNVNFFQNKIPCLSNKICPVAGDLTESQKQDSLTYIFYYNDFILPSSFVSFYYQV